MEPKAPQGEVYTPPSESQPNNAPAVEGGPISIERPSIAPQERVGEAAPRPVPITPVADDQTAVQLPQPVVVSQDDVSSTTDDTNPVAAADEDLIEKEWVERAKQIITDTKADPHKREVEVGKLQSDYLKKRYGKELGQST